MPMLLALPSLPNDAGVAAGANKPPMPTASAAASQPSRLPLEMAAAKSCNPRAHRRRSDPSSLPKIPAPSRSAAVPVKPRERIAPRIREPIDPAESAGATVGSSSRADAGQRGREDAGTTAGATVGSSSHPGSTVEQPDSGTQPRDRAGSAAAEDLLRQGAEALSAGKTDMAMAFFREAAASRPHDPQIPVSAAVAALRQNHPEAAVDLLEAAAGRFPKSAAVYRALGTACYRRTDYRGAQAH